MNGSVQTLEGPSYNLRGDIRVLGSEKLKRFDLGSIRSQDQMNSLEQTQKVLHITFEEIPEFLHPKSHSDSV